MTIGFGASAHRVVQNGSSIRRLYAHQSLDNEEQFQKSQWWQALSCLLLSDAIPIRQQAHITRLSAVDIAVLGRYLFKSRWQTALSRRLGVSRQIVVAWAGVKRPISLKYSVRIAEIVGQVHNKRGSWERASYLAMVYNIESESARTLLLSMLAEEIQVRVEAIGVLARNGTVSRMENARPASRNEWKPPVRA